MALPAWQTDELAEEWVEWSHDGSPESASFDSIKVGMRIVSGHTTFPSHQRGESRKSSIAAPSPPTSNRSGSDSSGNLTAPPGSTVPGTFLVKPENTDHDAANEERLKRNPFIGGGGDIAGQGGSLFQRLELERMFDPPRAVMAAPEEETSPPVAQLALRRTSHSYVPHRPSRLSNSMTPPGNQSTSASPSSSRSQVDEYDSSTSSEGGIQPVRRFSGQHGSMQDVEFTFSPTSIRKRPSAQTLVTHTSRSVSSSPATTATAGTTTGTGKKPPFRLFQRHVDTEGYDTLHTRSLIDRLTVGGTPLRDLVPSAAGARGYITGRKNRIGSGFSSRRRGRGGQLARQWSTSASPGTSGGWGSGSGVTSDVEERSRKRIRLSTDVSSADDDEEGYEYSASGSEDAVDRSLGASVGSQRRPHRETSVPPVDVSSASDTPGDGVGGERRSWGEKGQELIRRIREVGTSEKSDSWSGWSGSTDARREEGEGDGIAMSPATEQPPTHPEGPQHGTVTSSHSGGTASSGNTITSRYLSAGITMLEKIKERKVSDSSGTGVCTDAEGRGSGVSGRDGRESQDSPARGEGEKSTVRPAEPRVLSGRQFGTVKSAVSGSSRSDVASLGKGVAPTSLRAVAESSLIVEERPADQSSGRLGLAWQEDMNRYISSASTANTATTAISTSFIKHRGPPPPTPHGRAQGVRTIGLNDIPQIPRQVGNMVFDPVRGWVKAGKLSAHQQDREASPSSGGEGKSSSAESVDIFAGMESLRDDETTPRPESEPQVVFPRRRGHNLSPVLEVSFSHAVEDTLSPAKHMETVASVPSPEREPSPPDTHVTRLASLSLEKPREEIQEMDSHGHLDQYTAQETPQRPLARPELRECISAPTPLQTDPLHTPAVRSILKVGTTEMSATKTGKAPATPLSAIKIAVAPEDSARRSVSFSDGRTYGKIQEHAARQANGAARKQRNWNALAPEDDIFNSQDGSSNGEQSLLPMQPSVRSKRIQNMLTDLSQNASETPSKTSTSGSRKLSLLSEPSPASVTDNGQSESSFHTRVRQARRSKADATFLTECSFGVAHDRLVEVITEVQPYEPHWERLKTIDLSKRGVDSVARLKEFCPDLDEANLNNNQMSYLSGLPTSLRRLHVSFNKLTNVSSVDYLANLQYLDVSHNQIDSVNALSCLKHLRELRLDYNQVQDLKDIMGMDSLVKLSCKGNAIKTVDFSCAQWTNLESLDLSRNQISHVEGLENLSSLTTLNLDHNRLVQCTASAEMHSLRTLRLSHNRLTTVDISKFPRLRSLYADSNQIQTLAHSTNHKPVRLEYLSLRDQDVYDLSLSYDHLRDVKRLYISGNHLSSHFFPTRPLYSLVYLEAAACSLSEWPENFALRLPNLRILNMNYNFLEDLSGLEGLQGLRKLMMIGCRLGEERSSSVMRSVRQIGTLEEIDLRMNPLNLNFYLPLILNEASPATMIYPADASASDNAALASSSTDKWAGMDDKFRQLLPDKWYFKRLVYRGALKLACETVEVIDGIQLTHGEMRKAIELMEDAAMKGKTAV